MLLKCIMLGGTMAVKHEPGREAIPEAVGGPWQIITAPGMATTPTRRTDRDQGRRTNSTA
jgi:hypothetical protein